MPPDPTDDLSDGPKGLWLALSGGGLRAAIYHYGCLKRLHELGLLQTIRVVSATSGGAVAAALLVASGAMTPQAGPEAWSDFERRLLSAARDGLLGPMLWSVVAFSLYTLALPALLATLFAPGVLIASAPLLAGALCAHGIAFAALRRLRSEPTRVAALVRLDPRFGATAAALAGDRHPRRIWNDVLTASNPDAVRHFVLHHRLFDQRPLGDLPTSTRLFVVAADLSSGREMVFSSSTLADLSPAGCRALWRQDTDSQGPLAPLSVDDPDPSSRFRVSYNAYDIPISTAVAASSAYPPLFAPVQVVADGSHAGSFIDGGVIDNHALNVAYQMARHVNAARAHNFPAGILSDQISHLLTVDAGAAPVLVARPLTSRMGALIRRLPQILSSRQIQSAMDDAEDVERLAGVSTAVIGLQVGLPPDGGFKAASIGMRAARIRTHFDRFTPIEIATLAYLGYCWTDVWAQGTFPRVHAAAPRRSADPSAVLPEGFALPCLHDEAVAAHLAWSRHRSGLVRAVGRFFDRTRRDGIVRR